MELNEKPFFQDTEKDKKTWNINQCKKNSTKKETEKTEISMEKRRQKKIVLLQSKKIFFFGTVFCMKKQR